jgi:hypothetical protein
MIDVVCVGGSFLFLVLGWFVGKYLFPCHSFREPRWKTKDGSIVIGEKPHDAKRKTR